jgi:hypothetical protein
MSKINTNVNFENEDYISFEKTSPRVKEIPPERKEKRSFRKARATKEASRYE